jgi:uncharacterized protein (TIGR02300 family)
MASGGLVVIPRSRRAILVKPEWGAKRICYSCGARFYDLRRDPIVCPICSSVYDPDKQPRVRKPGPAVRDEPVLVTGAGVGALDEDLVDEEADDAEELEEGGDTEGDGALEELVSEDGELMEDTSELGADDDDIGEVMEHVDDELDEKP